MIKNLKTVVKIRRVEENLRLESKIRGKYKNIK